MAEYQHGYRLVQDIEETGPLHLTIETHARASQCELCGALVIGIIQHDGWHTGLSERFTELDERIRAATIDVDPDWRKKLAAKIREGLAELDVS